jgi:hypothetical protein
VIGGEVGWLVGSDEEMKGWKGSNRVVELMSLATVSRSCFLLLPPFVVFVVGRVAWYLLRVACCVLRTYEVVDAKCTALSARGR